MQKSLMRFITAILLLAGSSEAPNAWAEVTLPKVLGSHMVLQRDRPLTIWGWAGPAEQVTVRFGGVSATAKTNAQGNWKIVLPGMKADGKAHHMSIQGKNTIELDDILIGDVWLGSGQSNMEMGMTICEKAAERIAAANESQIRLLIVPKVQPPKPANDIPSKANDSTNQWMPCTPKTVAAGGWYGFSAPLYFFGRELHRELNVPIGLIESAWGGSPIEPWIIANGKSGSRYNGMIAPLTPLAIRGVVWYQGESNINNGLLYAGKMKDLIEGWRQAWGYDFPFFFVEIAPWSGYKVGLPPLWEAQVASLKIPKTGMVVTTDLVSDIKDIHPKQKLEVGHRLALWALAREYGRKDLVCSGPLYKSMKFEGSKARLTFAHIGGGLKSRDGNPLSEFEIAAANGKFVPAEATIDGDDVVVQSKAISHPAQVRFGWRNLANPNLVNKEGLPASPFQTSNWQGGTGE